MVFLIPVSGHVCGLFTVAIFAFVFVCGFEYNAQHQAAFLTTGGSLQGRAYAARLKSIPLVSRILPDLHASVNPLKVPTSTSITLPPAAYPQQFSGVGLDLPHPSSLAAFLAVPILLLWAFWSAYWRSHSLKSVDVFTKPDSPIGRLVQQCPAVTAGYQPAFWCTNQHVQTVLAGLFRTRGNVSFHRQLLPLIDGGTVALDWTRDMDGVRAAHAQGLPIVLVLHGVTGGSSETYVSHVAEEINDRGWVAVVLNMRGCGGSELTSPKVYCAAASWDCAEVAEYLNRVWPQSPLLAVGFSLGANVLTKYLGENGKQVPIKAAVSVGNPLDTLRCGRLLDSGISQSLYSKRICNKLKKYVVQHSVMLSQVMDLGALDSCSTTWEFDDRFTAPAFGFSSAEDYYSNAASSKKLSTVAVPLLCINAKDDPIAPGDEAYMANASENVVMVVTKCGGHLAWVEGLWPIGPNWADRLLLQFFDGVLQQ